MTPFIFCKDTNGKHSFYVNCEGEEYYLFTQKYKTGVEKFFGQGVPLSRALNKERGSRNEAVLKTMLKLPSHLRYIEKEYGCKIFRRGNERTNET